MQHAPWLRKAELAGKWCSENTLTMKDAYLAGYRVRDEEIAILKQKVGELEKENKKIRSDALFVESVNRTLTERRDSLFPDMVRQAKEQGAREMAELCETAAYKDMRAHTDWSPTDKGLQLCIKAAVDEDIRIWKESQK